MESIRRQHESVKKSIASSATRTEPPIVNGREEVLEYGTPTPLPATVDGTTANIGPTYPPSLLAEVQGEAGGIPRPPSSQPPFQAVSNPEVYYPSSVASQSGIRQEIRGGGSYGGYENNIQNSMAKLMVTSGADYVPSHNGPTTSSQAYDSSYPSTASGGKLYAPHDYSKPVEPQPSYSFSTSGETNTMVSSGYSAVQSVGSHNQEDTLREEIRKLQQQLQEKNATIAGLTSPSNTANLGSASSSSSHSHHRHSGPIQHHTYSGPIQVYCPILEVGLLTHGNFPLRLPLCILPLVARGGGGGGGGGATGVSF